MAKRKARVQYHWAPDASGQQRVYWTLYASNGESMFAYPQGSRDKTDARRSVDEVIRALVGDVYVSPGDPVRANFYERGPGPKPKNVENA